MLFFGRGGGGTYVTKRIEYLDGHRGLAILLVVGYHGFARWTEELPYGDTYASFPLFEFGYLGVQLFFLISGYVILLTLERTASIGEFAYKRWIRLFPAMLIASVVVFGSQLFLTERPSGSVGLIEFIPGLTFIDTAILEKVTGYPFVGLEGVFWSLYVEVKFYAVAALVFFVAGRRLLLPALVILFAGDWLLTWLHVDAGVTAIKPLFTLSSLGSFEHFGWFAAGAAYFTFHKSNKQRWFVIGSTIALLACVREGGTDLAVLAANLAVAALFAVSLVHTGLQRVLSHKFLLFLGVVSYPLYLIHENAMISATVQLSALQSIVPAEIVLLAVVGALTGVSYAIAVFGEPPLRNWLARRRPSRESQKAMPMAGS